MATLDLAAIPVREANERLRALGEAGEDVDIVNPDAQHHVGVGLTAPIRVRVMGSAGYFCAGLTDGPRFEVHGNVGWGLADNMLSGSVVVHGNASAIAGRRHPRRRGRGARQHRLARRPGDEGAAARSAAAATPPSWPAT